MSFTMCTLAVLSLLSSSFIFALPIPREAGPSMISLPLRRLPLARRSVSPNILFEQHVNRARRRHATLTGVQGPSDSELEANIMKLYSGGNPYSTSLPAKRFNREGTKFPNSPNRIKNTELSLHEEGADPGAEESETSDNGGGITDAEFEALKGGFTPAEETTAPNSLGLSIIANDVGYFSDVTIGSQTFRLLMDSGSADLWVGFQDCEAEGGGNCGDHVFLGPLSSKTFNDTGKDWDITYGSGSVKGTIVTDDLDLAGLKLPAHSFGVAKIESEEFAGDTPFDGLMGLARSSISNQKALTPVEALAKKGLIKEAITSYKMGRAADGENDGQITFGGLDESKFDKSTLVTVDNVSKVGFWEADIDKVTANGVDLNLEGRTALLDTGTTLLIAPRADVEKIHEVIGGRANEDGRFIVPCNINATVALSFGGHDFAIDPKDLAFFPLSGNPTGDCLSGITASDRDDGSWLVGDTFLKSTYFSTNVDKNTISLAELV